MSQLRNLRGGCQCGRNRYIIAVPDGGVREAQVLFNTEPTHQIPLATPLAAYIRVPLSWYHSTTYSFFPDETHSLIRRVYTHPTQEHSKRHFCGYCGTPLSYWSEDPRSEAEYIHLTLGSLLQDDLSDLEDMGLLPNDTPDSSDQSETSQAEAGGVSGTATPTRSTALRQSYGVSWFEGLLEDTRLGNMTRSHGIKRSKDGMAKVEWEVIEFNGDDGAPEDADMEDLGSGSNPSAPAKRKRESLDAAAAASHR